MMALLLVLAALTLLAVVDREPAVLQTVALTPDDVSRAQALWQTADPRQAPPGKSTAVAMTARDVELLLNEASVRLLRGSAAVRLNPTVADVRISAPVPRWPVRAWVNLQASLRESGQGLPQVSSLHIGRLPVPASLAIWAVRLAAGHFGAEGAVDVAAGMVEQVRIAPEGVTATVRWNPALADQVKATLVPAALHEPMRSYSERLAALVAPTPDAAPVGLTRLLPPLFRLAESRTRGLVERSGGTVDDNDARARTIAAAENRAALITLALYASGQPMTRFVPAATDWPVPKPRVVWINGREDHPQHLLISAALAAEGGGRLADAVGVLKEMVDRSGGSGFSFDDLAADRAGTRLGQLAVREPREFQRRMQLLAKDADLMPAIDGLPSFLNQADFQSQIGGEGSPRYRELLQDIEARVAALAVLR